MSRLDDVGGAAVMNLVKDLARDDISGRYFSEQDEELPSVQARDDALARELWDHSLEWTENHMGQMPTDEGTDDARV